MNEAHARLDAANRARRESQSQPRNPIQKALDDPKSRAKAVRAYFWDMEKVLANQGTPEAAEQRRAAEARFRAARHTNLGFKAVVRDLCMACVGQDADEPVRVKIRDCAASGCALHQVRPWQDFWGSRRARPAQNQNAGSS